MIAKISSITSISITNLSDFFYGVFLVLIGLFYPIISLIYFAGFLIILDIITGVWASKKRGEDIDSKKLSRSVSKAIMYPFAIMLAHLCERFLTEIPFVKGVTFLLIVVEGKSLDENMKDILGFSFFKYIKAFLIDGKKGLFKEMDKKKHQ